MAKNMISLDDACSVILGYPAECDTEQINFSDSLGRVLAEDIFSDTDMPPFDKSAMDGFAIRSEDMGNELEIIETIPAGKYPEKRVYQGFCSRIMTGAPVPEGSDMVVMVEDVEVTDNRIRIVRRNNKANICYTGEDVKKGEKILVAGCLIRPQHIAMLASAGHTGPKVYKKPVVQVAVTGDELTEPSSLPQPSKIRNSNAYQIMALLNQNGISTNYSGICKDNKEEIISIIRKSLNQNDFLILTGGASKGDFDLVPLILKEEGFTVHFEEVAIQPGKPVCFATKGKKVCFGLSGNPVSSFFQFELLVKPFLKQIKGLKEKEPLMRMKLGETVTRKKSERQFFFPVKITGNFEAVPVEFHGSAHIHALTGADGIADMKPGEKELKKGDYIHVRPL